MIDERRIEQLRAAIFAGTYEPPPDAVAESMLGWIVPPEEFERPTSRSIDRSVDAAPVDATSRETDTRR